MHSCLPYGGRPRERVSIAFYAYVAAEDRVFAFVLVSWVFDRFYGGMEGRVGRGSLFEEKGGGKCAWNRK